jgi:proline racemase
MLLCKPYRTREDTRRPRPRRLPIGEPFVVKSLIGTRFTGRVVRTTAFGEFAAVIPDVEGSEWITGRNEFWIAPDDPLKEGSILR